MWKDQQKCEFFHNFEKINFKYKNKPVEMSSLMDFERILSFQGEVEYRS
jgi:hypothetical protein